MLNILRSIYEEYTPITGHLVASNTLKQICFPFLRIIPLEVLGLITVIMATI